MTAWWYWLMFAAAAGLLVAAIRSLWRERVDKRLWEELHPLTPETPITPLREATVLAMALGNLLNSLPAGDEARQVIRDHFDEVADNELEAGRYSRLVADSMLASVTGLTRRLRAVGGPR